MASSERIILIDASALIYRAYYAIPANFSTASGLHTNAIYGFATMFRKILSGRKPERGAVVFDAPGKTFRDEKYPDYKAQRPRMDPELREQLEWVDKLVEAHRFPRLRVPGYEADDVIGTLTRMAVAKDMEVHIISGDKDFAQLISDKVRMIDTLRDVTFDVELVRKKWGVTPDRFVDFLARVLGGAVAPGEGDEAEQCRGGDRGEVGGAVEEEFGELGAGVVHVVSHR